MSTEENSATKHKLPDHEIDKIASLWNQLRDAWREFHLDKKKDDGSKRKSEMHISNLLNELGIKYDNEIFNLTIDNVPELTYHYGRSN